jgi:PilZ domain
MAVQFGKKLPPTCKVYFQFQLPGQMASVRLSGQVIWQDWNGRAGIQFVDVPQASRRVLQEWLKVTLANAPKQELNSDAPVEVEHSISPKADFTSADRNENTRTEKDRTDDRPEKDRPEKDRAEKERTEKDRQSRHHAQKHEIEVHQVLELESKGSEGETGARLRSEHNNRRGKDRYACRIGAEVYKSGSSVRNYCHLSDLGTGGCYLEMPLAFPAGTAIEIVVRTHEMKLRLSGEVRASHPGYGMGISFKLNTKDERAGVQQLIDFVAATTESS